MEICVRQSCRCSRVFSFPCGIQWACRININAVKRSRGDPELEKCNFLEETIDYMGYILRPREVEVSSHTTDVSMGVKLLLYKTDLKSLLVLCDVFCRMEPRSARIEPVLHEKLCKVQLSNFVQNASELEQMKMLLQEGVSQPVVPLPCQRRLIFDKETCDVQVWSV